jgi:hypothetical protein
LAAHAVLTRGYGVESWFSGDVGEAAAAIAAVIGPILGLIWRGSVWLVARVRRRGGRGSGGRGSEGGGPSDGRAEGAGTKVPGLTVVPADPDGPQSAPAERRSRGPGEATQSAAAQVAAGGESTTLVEEESPIAPTMWPMPPLEPPMPLEGADRPRDAD